MADMTRRPSSIPSEEYYKARMANSSQRATSRSQSIQGADVPPRTLSGFISANRALFLLSEENCVRRVCKKIVESKVSFKLPLICAVFSFHGVVHSCACSPEFYAFCSMFFYRVISCAFLYHSTLTGDCSMFFYLLYPDIFCPEFLLCCCCISLTETKPFEYFILLTIFVNCILLAANTPLPKGDKSDLNIELVRKYSDEKFHEFVVGHICKNCTLFRPYRMCSALAQHNPIPAILSNYTQSGTCLSPSNSNQVLSLSFRKRQRFTC